MKQKKDRRNYFIICVVTILLVLLGSRIGAMFGSSTDWVSQHTTFPDYFRTLFYETHKLIPSFAPSLGAGQNIWYFSYYGLLNPVLLLSYLLPFVKMTTYIQIVNVLLLMVSSCLCYRLLSKHSKKATQNCILSLLFLSMSALIYQAHRHFMFVSYMPFLLLAMLGLERRKEGKGSLLLIVSIFLMILTSYYYSIGGLLALGIYHIYLTCQEKDLSFASFWKKTGKTLIPVLLGILLAAFFLLPTAYAITHGRGTETGGISLIKLLFPNFDLANFLYDGYTLGISLLPLLAVFFLLSSKKREQRILSILLCLVMFFPLFLYLLNGGLYLRSKVLIPLLPLYFVQLQNFLLEEERRVKHSYGLGFVILFLGILYTVVLHSLKWYLLIFLLLDVVLCLSIVFCRTRKKQLLKVYLGICFVVCICLNQTENYMSKDHMKRILQDPYVKEVTKALKNETTIVRSKNLNEQYQNINRIPGEDYYGTSLYSSTQNEYYHHFYRNQFYHALGNRNQLMLGNAPNVLFDSFMGIRYVSESHGEKGYTKVDEHLFRNDLSRDILYGVSDLLSLKEFETYGEEEKIEALLTKAIVENGNSSFTPTMRRVTLSFEGEDSNLIEQEVQGNKLILTVKEKTKTTFRVKENLTNQILLLSFQVENESSCNDPDRFISINGIVNKLTCKEWLYHNRNYRFHYVFGPKGNDEDQTFEVELEKGTYVLSNLVTVLYDYDEFVKSLNQITRPTSLQYEKGSYQAEITMKENGYLVTSIPYDEGFQVFIDKKEVKSELVNLSFLGVPLTKGEHEIEVVYQAPWLNHGKKVSSAAFLGTILYLIFERKRNQKKV